MGSRRSDSSSCASQKSASPPSVPSWGKPAHRPGAARASMTHCLPRRGHPRRQVGNGGSGHRWHFLGRGFVGKAMVVSIDKATALKMHDKVRKHWAAETERVQKELGRYDLPQAEQVTLRARLDLLNSTDMALIVSPGQNEIEQLKKQGLDIVPHRRWMNESQPPLDEKFKDPEDPLRIVFLCAMWLTGFDAPSCSTMYLDKPIRHSGRTIQRGHLLPGGEQVLLFIT